MQPTPLAASQHSAPAAARKELWEAALLSGQSTTYLLDKTHEVDILLKEVQIRAARTCWQDTGRPNRKIASLERPRTLELETSMHEASP